MAVAFDAVGPSSSGTSATTGTSLTWTHVCDVSATLLLVGVGAPQTTSTYPLSATYGGVSMTSLGTRTSNSGTDGYVEVFALSSPPTGSNSVVVTVTNASPLSVSAPMVGGSQSYIGASGTQNVATATGNSTTPSVTVTSSSGNMTAAFMVCSSALSAANQTLRFRKNLSDNNAAGNIQGEDASGASSVTLTGTHASDWWGALGLDIIASGGGGGGTTVAWIQ